MMRQHERLDKRQWIVLFIAGVTLCFTFFALGLYVGRWSVTQPVNELTGREDISLPPSAAASSLVSDQGAASEKNEPAAARPRVETRAELPPPNKEPAAVTETELSSPTSEKAGATQSPQDEVAELGGSRQEKQPPQPSSARHLEERTKLFYVRAGEFQKAADAEELAARLRSRGFISAHTKRVLSEAGVASFQVLLGPWVDRGSAVRTKTDLRRESLSEITIVSQ